MSRRKDEVFKAIADPARRKIIHLLVAAAGAMTIHQVSDHFPFTRQAVTKHLVILEKARLIRIKKSGRERYCYPSLESLQEVYQWVMEYQRFWDDKLNALENYLNKKNPPSP